MTLVSNQAHVGKNARVNAWVQSLYAAIQGFRKTGNLRNLGNRDARSLDCAVGATGRDDVYASFIERLSKFEKTGFV